MADVYTVNIDVVDMTIPIGNNRMIPVIMEPNPALGYAATASEVSLLLKLANYRIYEAGTSNIIDSYNFTDYFPSSGGGGGGGGGDKSRYTVEKTTDGTTGEATYKLMQSINGARATAVGDVIGIRGNEMLVQYGNSVIILNTAIADIKEKMDATYNFTTFNELDITTSGKTLKEITDELHALNLPTNTVVTGQLYSDALPFSGNGEAEVMINKPAYWWKCTSLNVAPYSWNAIAGGGSWSGIIMDWTPTYNPATTYETTGSGNAITDASYSNGKLTFTKGSTFLTGHPAITPGTNTTSTAAPAVGETFTAIDGITKDANGHVTAINTKTVTMPTPTKSNVGLSEVTNDKQIKGLSTGTTAGNLVKFGNDGYTVEDSGVGIETGFTSNSDAKVPTSKSITTNVAGNAKLTGYSVDTARENINANSTITDAVEQLEYREETNKNNISLSEERNPMYNIFNFKLWADECTVYRGTKTVTENSITLTATGDTCITHWSESAFPIGARVSASAGDKVVLLWESDNTTGTKKGDVWIFANGLNAGGTSIHVDDNQGIIEWTCPAGTTFLTFGFGVDTNGNTIKYSNIRLIPKSLYDAGFTDYQPYALPNTTLTPVLVECVNNGKKNILNFDLSILKANNTSGTWNGNEYTISGVKYTINADKSISVTIPATATTANADMWIPIEIELNKTYIISGGLGTTNNFVKQAVSYGTSFSPIAEIYTASQTAEFTETSDRGYYRWRIRTYTGATSSLNGTIKPMVCLKSVYNASSTYQPYAMSNVELTTFAPTTTTTRVAISSAETYQTISDLACTVPAGKTIHITASGYWGNGYCKGIEIYTGETLQDSMIIGKNETSTGYLTLSATALYKNMSNADITVNVAVKQSATGDNTYSVYANIV